MRARLQFSGNVPENVPHSNGCENITLNGVFEIEAVSLPASLHIRADRSVVVLVL